MIDNSSRVSGSLLSRRICQMVRLDPGAPALFFDGLTFSWSFYSDAVADLASLLAAYPAARRVGIVLRNRPGPLAALIATLGTGREVVTLSPHLGDIGLERDVVDLAPDVVVAEDADWARDAVLVSSKAVRAIGLVFDEAHEPHLRSRTDILWASLAHISGLYFAIAQAVEGRSIALLEKFEVGPWTALVKRHRPGYVRLAPTALRMVLQAGVPADTFESVRAVGSGTAPLPPELAEEFEERYGIPVLGTYGATEFAGAIAGWTLKDKKQWGARKRGSVGRAHHGIELRIVDPDTGDVLPAAQTGLLEARGGQLPGEEGAWLRTTDLATIDDDQFLFIRGRADDAINRGGFKIPPSVIEDALAAHPAVDEASAVALPDARLGQVPAAAVTLLSPATEEELMQYLASRLTRYQQPVAIKVVDQLPRTPSLKISRALVREHYFDVTPNGAVSPDGLVTP